jgi:hypothetical protein
LAIVSNCDGLAALQGADVDAEFDHFETDNILDFGGKI